MKEMTSAEFAKANLAALEEPVSVRRYTKIIGAYYPSGFEPKPSLEEAIIEPALTNAATKVKELEEEVSRLKRELAARPEDPHRWFGDAAVSAVVRYPERTQKTVTPKKAKPDDILGSVPPENRDFFERKLGKAK